MTLGYEIHEYQKEQISLANLNYYVGDSNHAHELEGKLNTAVVTGIIKNFSFQTMIDLLESITFLTQRERIHIALSVMHTAQFCQKIIEPNFSISELETIRFCVSKMLEVNKLQHGEMCASILTGDYDRTEEFERVLTKLSTLK